MFYSNENKTELKILGSTGGCGAPRFGERQIVEEDRPATSVKSVFSSK